MVDSCCFTAWGALVFLRGNGAAAAVHFLANLLRPTLLLILSASLSSSELRRLLLDVLLFCAAAMLRGVTSFTLSSSEEEGWEASELLLELRFSHAAVLLAVAAGLAILSLFL